MDVNNISSPTGIKSPPPSTPSDPPRSSPNPQPTTSPTYHTPPASPPADPDVRTLYDSIGRVEKGERANISLVTKLSDHQYQKLLETIRQVPALNDFLCCKLRYDWTPEDGQTLGVFEIRMPTTTHDEFAHRVGIALFTRITDQAQPCVAKLSNVLGDATLRMGPDINLPSLASECKKCPDAAIGWEEEIHPIVAIEVLFSQKRRDIVAKVNGYMKGSSGGIKTILAFHLGYRTPEERAHIPSASHPVPKASYNIYKARKVRNESDRLLLTIVKSDWVVFRGTVGQCEEGSFRIPLRDLCPEHPDVHIDPLATITLSHQELCDMLSSAEQRQRKVDQMASQPDPLEDFEPLEEGSESDEEQQEPSESISGGDEKADLTYEAPRKRAATTFQSKPRKAMKHSDF